MLKNEKYLIIVSAIVLCVVSTILFKHAVNPSKEDKSLMESASNFSFTAAGDFYIKEAANSVLTKIGDTPNDFTLALGDLGYTGNGTEKTWCKFVLDRIGTEHPFQIVAGNHDDGSKDGDIRAYRECLPNKIDGLIGDYGIQYYFDYKNLARFILISPDIDNYGFDYVYGSENLNWVIDKVIEARKNNIEWVFLAMHKNCITPGIKSCEIGEDLLNASVENGVDVVLQGHEHAYFRSKQLALNSETCPVIVVNDTDQDCISGQGDELRKRNGTVVVISGAGGYPLREINFEDPEFGYFDAVNGSNSGNTYGFSLFNVSRSSIEASFIPVLGKYTDSFVIK